MKDPDILALLQKTEKLSEEEEQRLLNELAEVAHSLEEQKHHPSHLALLERIRQELIRSSEQV